MEAFRIPRMLMNSRFAGHATFEKWQKNIFNMTPVVHAVNDECSSLVCAVCKTAD